MANEDDNPSNLSLLGYLVRSKKFRVPRNWPRNPQTSLKQMEMLKEVELLQNIQIQKSLKSLMKELDIGKRKSIGELKSAREYMQDIQRQKCHENVERIRKLRRQSCKELFVSKTFHNEHSSNLAHVANCMKESVQNTCSENSNLKEIEKTARFGDFYEYRSLNYSEVEERKAVGLRNKVEQKLKLPTLVNQEITSISNANHVSYQQLHQPTNEITLPKHDATPNLNNMHLSKPNIHCTPVLDSQSRFSIIRTARMLRLNRHDFSRESHARKELHQRSVPKNTELNSKSLDLFADNYELLSPRYLASKGPEREPMELLDSDSFDDIDRDDFLQLENRIVALSPFPIIIKNKQAKNTSLTKLELRRGFR